MTVLELLNYHAESQSSKLALVDSNKEINYGQLTLIVREISQKLETLLHKNECLVRLNVVKDIYSAILFLSLLEIGVSVLPVAEDDEINIPYSHTISQTKFQENDMEFICYGENYFINRNDNFNSSLLIENDILFAKYINSTSGSSGAKKYCISDWYKVLVNTEAVCSAYNINTDVVWLSLFPAHMHIYESFLRGLYVGGTSILVENTDLSLIADYILRYGITNIQGTPNQLISLNTRVSQNTTMSVISIECAGGLLSENAETLLKQNFTEAIISRAWGSSETTGVCITSHSASNKSPFNIGKVIKPYKFKLSDNDITTMLICGESIVKTIWDTGKIIHIGEWFDTKDIVEIVDDNILFRGRLSGMIKCGGENIYPEEIEAIISKISGILDCIVFGIDDNLRGETIVALIQVSQISSISEEYIKLQALSYGLRINKIPKLMKIVPFKLPYKQSGKKDRQKAKEIYLYK